MKKPMQNFGFLALVTVTGLLIAGCASLFSSGSGAKLSIRTENNLSSVISGGTLRCSATVQGVAWDVSSTSDGSGSVSDGTYILSDGTLIISANETLYSVFVIATNTNNGESVNRQIRIVTVTDVKINPADQSVRRGNTLQFSAAVTGTNNPDSAVTWRVSSNATGSGAVAAGTSIAANGLLTIGAGETLPSLYVMATAVVDPSKSASVHVPVIIPTVSTVTISPANQSITSGRTLQLQAAVTGTNEPDNTVTWKVSSNSAGTGAVAAGTSIDKHGLLTAAPNETLRSLYVFATSVEDSTKSASIIIPVVVPTVTSVSVSPSNMTITRGTSLQFSATVTGTNDPSDAVTWKVSSNAAGTGAVTMGTSIDNNGLLTVSAGETAALLYIIATSETDTTKSGSAPVNVIIPIVTSVMISQGNQSVQTGNTLQFTAAVTGTNNPNSAVTWLVSSTVSGTGAVTRGTSISNTGLLTVASGETANVLYIIATSVEDSSKSASVYVTVTVAIPSVTGVTISPANQSVGRGNTLQFTATVTGANNPDNSVAWSVSSNAAGTGAVTRGTSISNSGLLTVASDESLTTLYVFANSAADSSKFASVPVTVSGSISTPTTPAAPTTPTTNVPTVTSVTVSPANQSVTRGNTLQFSAIVTGTNNPNTSVTWRVSSNSGGSGSVTRGTSINSSGLLTVASNESASTLYVFATSLADNSKSASTSVRVTASSSSSTPPPSTTPTVTSVTVSPANQSVTRGNTLQFSAIVTGANNPNTSVTWSVSSNSGGSGNATRGTSINNRGLLTVASNESANTLYVFATSTTDNSKSASVSVSVTASSSSSTPPPSTTPTVTSVTVSPANQSVARENSLQFSAAVTGTNNPSTAVTWRVSSNSGGSGNVTSGTSINSSGLLTVASNESANTLYVFATSTADTSKSASVSVRITTQATSTTPPASTGTTVTGITVSPSTYATRTNTTVQIRATVVGTNNPSTNVTWAVSSNAAGNGAVAPRTTVSTTGLLTVAPNEWSPTLYVIATSVADTSKTATAVVTISNNNANQGSNQGS